MRHPDPSLLVRIAIADAYAAAAEYVNPKKEPELLINLLHFQEYQNHPRHPHRTLYTDDTEMSIANALVLSEGRFPYASIQFADAYVREFAYGGRRKGYSGGFQDLLEEVQTGAELLDRLRPDSRKNGAAMRAVPIGVLPHIKDVLSVATLQAAITHNTPEGRFSARIVALMSHFALYTNTSFSVLPEYCRQHLLREDHQFFWIFDLDWPSNRPVEATKKASVGITTVHAARTALMRCKSLMEMLERIIRCGGDTDSVAAITWGIASPRFQDEKLPDFMERDLENGNPKTGAERLRDVGTQLMGKYG
jgi:ADP-ribosyl-[dinitrogen reductase] hydrolase